MTTLLTEGKQSEKIPAHYNTPDYYRHYKNKNFGSNRQSRFYVKSSKYTAILKDFFDLVVEDLIMTGTEFIFPYGLGKLQIRKTKATVKVDEEGNTITKYPIDFGATMKLRREDPEAEANKVVVRHLNKHTDGYIFKFYYLKSKAFYRNKSAYSFKPTRTNKEKVAKAVRIHKKKIDYLKLY